MSRSSQASISINSFTELSKTQFSLWVSLSHLIKAVVNKSQGQKMTENILHLFNKKRREEQRGRKLV